MPQYIKIYSENIELQPTKLAAWSNARVYGRSLAGIAVSSAPAAWMFVVSVVCCQLEVYASG